jgi:type II secretion system protein N
MATMSEIRSLDEVDYKLKIKIPIIIGITLLVFIGAFSLSYPINEKLKTFIKTQLKVSGCQVEFNDIDAEIFLPKIVVSDISIPAHCLGKTGENLKLNYLKINWHIIHFFPFGIPLRLDTEYSGQPISLYFVQGINQQLIRLKDQKFALHRFDKMLGKFKLAGNITVDLNLLSSEKKIKNLSLKAVSSDFSIPSQNLEGFTLPNMKIKDFYLEANSENHPKIQIDKLIIGNTQSPIRANFKGKLDYIKENISFSPLNLNGEIAFSSELKESIPLLELIFQSFNQKDGFYQIRLGGTLGSPKPLSL